MEGIKIRQDEDCDAALLWLRYWNERSVDNRADLIARYTPLVEKIAGYLFANRITDDVLYDDFFQMGIVGLIESIDRFNADRGASFETYAAYRIKGAILSGLAKMSEHREQLDFRKRVRKERLESLTETDRNEGGKDLFDELVDVALGLAVGFMLEDTSFFQSSSEGQGDSVYQSIEVHQIQERLVEAVEALPSRERLVIFYHYFQHTGFEEIANVMGLSKGRISQLHKRALELVRQRFRSISELNGYF